MPKILVVDDERVMVKGIKFNLENEGYQVETGSDGEEAVEKARAEDAERLAAMEKQLAAADGDVAAFRVHYEAWQEHFNKMSGYLTKISGRDPERAGKLRMAMKAAVERMAEW